MLVLKHCIKSLTMQEGQVQINFFLLYFFKIFMWANYVLFLFFNNCSIIIKYFQIIYCSKLAKICLFNVFYNSSKYAMSCVLTYSHPFTSYRLLYRLFLLVCSWVSFVRTLNNWTDWKMDIFNRKQKFTNFL